MDRTPLSPGPLIYAHRGDRSRAPDNTIKAFLLAVDAGADGIELDVRRTRDGVLIVHHDDHNEASGVFCELDFADLREASPDVPTLREAMEAIPRDVFVNVEIKNEISQADFDAERSLVGETLAFLREEDDFSRILLSSFDPIAMQIAKELEPEIVAGQLIVNVVPLEAGISIARQLNLQAVHPPLSHLLDNTASHVERMHNHDLFVVAWTVNAPEDVRLLASSGVDVIITDDPGAARAAIE